MQEDSSFFTREALCPQSWAEVSPDNSALVRPYSYN